MPLLRINALDDRPVTEDGAQADAALHAALDALPAGAPVVVMIHGYKHSPSTPGHSPHSHMLSLAPTRGGRSLSWPKHLGFGRGNSGEGLAVAFGWEARGTIWQAYRSAGRAGVALGRLIRLLRERREGPVDAIAHSLGARVTLGALAALPARSVGRAVLLSGAEFRSVAEAAMATPAGAAAEILNVTSGENAVFDLMFERFLQGPASFDRAIGAGLARPRGNWVDLRIDCEATRAHLGTLGFRIPPPARAVCHWSGYMRPGIFGVYRRMLDPEDGAFPVRLRSALADAAARSEGRDEAGAPPHAARV